MVCNAHTSDRFIYLYGHHILTFYTKCVMSKSRSAIAALATEFPPIKPASAFRRVVLTVFLRFFQISERLQAMEEDIPEAHDTTPEEPKKQR